MNHKHDLGSNIFPILLEFLVFLRVEIILKIEHEV